MQICIEKNENHKNIKRIQMHYDNVWIRAGDLSNVLKIMAKTNPNGPKTKLSFRQNTIFFFFLILGWKYLVRFTQFGICLEFS